MRFTEKKKFKAALFDFDGTLFFTDRANYLSYSYAVSQEGYTLSEEEFIKVCSGKDYKTFLKLLYPDITEEQCKNIHFVKLDCYKNFYNEITPNYSALTIAECLKASMKLGIVTTATRKNVIEILDYYNISDMFDFIISKEDVKNQKPSPECYFQALKQLNASSDEVIAFEDSDIGIEAAEKAIDFVYRLEHFGRA